MRKAVLSSTVALFVALPMVLAPASLAQAVPAQQTSAASPGVILLIIDAPGGPEASGRFLTAIRHATQLRRAGLDAKMVFDGQGIRWLGYIEGLPEALTIPDNMGGTPWTPAPEFLQRLNKEWAQLLSAGVPFEASASAAQAWGLKDKLAARKVPLVQKSAAAALDLAGYVKKGYQVWVF